MRLISLRKASDSGSHEKAAEFMLIGAKWSLMAVTDVSGVDFSSRTTFSELLSDTELPSSVFFSSNSKKVSIRLSDAYDATSTGIY